MGIFDKFKSHDDKEEKKAKADFSGVKSGGSSTADAAQKGAAPKAGVTTYTVEAGDSLWKISEKFYGDGNQWRRIYEANKGEIKDPDVIHPGQTFTIPATKGEGQ
ncbi:MAG: LysM peptidoglycan-binding domain-containing protein [Gemmatimonadota bacterium]